MQYSFCRVQIVLWKKAIKKQNIVKGLSDYRSSHLYFELKWA